MKLTLRFLILTMLTTGMTGCDSCNNRKCLVGQEIVIPSSDTTDPSPGMEVHLPNGNIVNVTPGTSTIAVPGGGKVLVVVNAKDPEGIQDAQIWAAEIKTTIDPNTGAATGGNVPLIRAPMATNKDSATAGQNGCTERIVTTNLEVSKTPTGSVSYEVFGAGINFAGKKVETKHIRLEAQ
jgi:hypothetical protein